MPEQELSRFETMKQGVKEAFGNGFDHLRSGIDSLRQNVDRLKAIGQIAAVGAGAGMALPSAVGAEGPINNTSPAIETTTSGVSQDCVREALAEPKVIYAKMLHPGAKNQLMTAKLSYRPISDACDSEVERKGQVQFQIQDPKNHKHWIKTPNKAPFNSKTSTYAGNNEGGVGEASFSTVGIIDPKYSYRCSKTGTTGARVIIINKSRTADGNKRQKQYTEPLRIVPKSKEC